jgi:hypothetical protein
MPHSSRFFEVTPISFDYPEDLLGALHVIRDNHLKFLIKYQRILPKETIQKCLLHYSLAVFFSLLWEEDPRKKPAIFANFKQMYRQVIGPLSHVGGTVDVRVQNAYQKDPFLCLQLSEDSQNNYALFIDAFARTLEAQDKETADHRLIIGLYAVIPVVSLLLFSQSVAAIAVCCFLIVIALWFYSRAVHKTRDQDFAIDFVTEQKKMFSDMWIALKPVRDQENIDESEQQCDAAPASTAVA